MKKSLIVTSVLALSLMFNSGVYAEDNSTPQITPKKATMERKMPTLYDKDGNKLPPPPFCKKHMPKGPDLNLTDKQKEKADQIREASKKKIKPIRREIHTLKNEIWEIKEDDSLTMEEQQAKIEPLMKKIETLRSKANSVREEDMKQFEKLLTKDQKKILDEFKKTHKLPVENPGFKHPHKRF